MIVAIDPLKRPWCMEPLTDEQKRLVDKNIKLVYKFGHKYFNTSSRCQEFFENPADVIQTATFGLMRAVQQWQPERSKLSTIAYRCMRQACMMEIKHRVFIRSSLNTKFPEIMLTAFDDPKKDTVETFVGRGSYNNFAFISLAQCDISSEAQNDIQRLLTELTPLQRLIVLRIADGLRPADVAKELKMTRHCLNQILYRLQEKMRTKYFEFVYTKNG